MTDLRAINKIIHPMSSLQLGIAFTLLLITMAGPVKRLSLEHSSTGNDKQPKQETSVKQLNVHMIQLKNQSYLPS